MLLSRGPATAPDPSDLPFSDLILTCPEAMRVLNLSAPAPEFDDFNIEPLDIHAMAAREFGVHVIDGDSTMDI